MLIKKRTMTNWMRLTRVVKSSLTLVFVSLVACTSHTTVNTKPDDSQLSAVAREIRGRGYRVEKSSVLTPTVWEVSKFRMRSKRMVAFKAEQPMPNENDTYYCRFTLSEETFDSDDDARQRLAQLHNAFPDGPVEDEYTLVLRDGFRVGRTAYILQTDASKFLNEIRRLTQTLTESTAGAERAQNGDQDGSKEAQTYQAPATSAFWNSIASPAIFRALSVPLIIRRAEVNCSTVAAPLSGRCRTIV